MIDREHAGVEVAGKTDPHRRGQAERGLRQALAEREEARVLAIRSATTYAAA
jgi:hypothetical protein